MLFWCSHAAAEPGALTSDSRLKSESIYKSQLDELTKRAKDFRRRRKKEQAYQKEVNSHIKAHKAKKDKQERDYELARKIYSKKKKSRKVIPLEVYKPAHDAKMRAYQRDYEDWQRKYSEHQKQIKRALKDGKNNIPEDEELGLSYQEMQQKLGTQK